MADSPQASDLLSRQIDVKVLTQLPGSDREVTFTKLPAGTLVAELKLRIRDAVSTKPIPDMQRLIYRGRPMASDTETLLDCFGKLAIQRDSLHTLHAVLRDPASTAAVSSRSAYASAARGNEASPATPSPSTRPEVRTGSPAPLAPPGLPRPGPPPNWTQTGIPLPPHVSAALGRQMPPGQGVAPGASPVPNVSQQGQAPPPQVVQGMFQMPQMAFLPQVMPSIPGMPGIPDINAIIQQQLRQQIQQQVEGQIRQAEAIHGRQVNREDVQRQIEEQVQRAFRQLPAQGQAPVPSAVMHPNSGNTETPQNPDRMQEQTTIPPQTGLQADTANRAGTAAPAPGTEPQLPQNAQPLAAQPAAHQGRGLNGAQWSFTYTNAMPFQQQPGYPAFMAPPPPFPPGFPGFPGPPNMMGPVPFQMPHIHARPPHPASAPSTYVLYSPEGPRALLFSPQGTYSSSVPPSHSTPAAHASMETQPIPTTQAPAQEQPVGNNHNNNNQQLVPLQLNARPADHPEHAAEVNQAFGQVLRAIWVVMRILGFIWFFTAGNVSWYTWGFAGAAVVYWAAQAGLLGDGPNRLQRYWEGLVGVPGPAAAAAQPGQNGANEAQQQQHRPRHEDDTTTREQRRQRRRHERGMLEPRETAERLMRERRDGERGWLRERLRPVERGVALFIGSLYPGIGERQVAARERAVREAEEQARTAERQRIEAEAAAASGEAAETSGSSSSGTGQPTPASSAAGENGSQTTLTRAQEKQPVREVGTDEGTSSSVAVHEGSSGLSSRKHATVEDEEWEDV